MSGLFVNYWMLWLSHSSQLDSLSNGLFHKKVSDVLESGEHVVAFRLPREKVYLIAEIEELIQNAGKEADSEE